MQLVAEFMNYAAQCQKIAEVLEGTEYKRPLMEMATAWILLAHERKAMLIDNQAANVVFPLSLPEHGPKSSRFYRRQSE